MRSLASATSGTSSATISGARDRDEFVVAAAARGGGRLGKRKGRREGGAA